MAGTASQKGRIDRLTKSAHQAVDRVGEKAEAIYEMPEQWLESARDYVREHPLAAVGIGFAAGYLYRLLSRG